MIRLAFIFLLLNTVAQAQVNLDAGLVAYYPFNNTVKDQSGYNNDPVFNNTSFTNDRFGNKNGACYFNGKNNYLHIPNRPSLCPQEMTIVAIVKPMGFYDGLCYNNTIVDKGEWDYVSGVYSLRFTAGEYTKGNCYQQALNSQNFVGAISTNEGATSKEHYVKPGTWYCVVFTVSNQSTKLWLDGQLISTHPHRAPIGRNSDDLFIGKKDNTQYPYWFNGVMDEIRMYNRALNKDEVLALCGTVVKEDGPVPCIGLNKPAAQFSFTISDCNKAVFKTTDANQKNIKSVQWYFGDGSSSAKKSPVHVYAKAGKYKVRSIITNENGCSDTATREIQVQLLKADFSFTEPGEPGILSFRAKSNNASYTWDFGDGSPTKNDAVVTHQFTKDGAFTVRLIANNNSGCRDTVEKTIGIMFPQQLITESPAPTINEIIPNSPTPVQLEKRTKDIVRTIIVEHNSISIAIYDNGIIDGDSITLLFNGQPIASRVPLGVKAFTTTLKIDRQLANNELLMYADNLGSIPPNTALLLIHDGNNRYTVNLSSNQTTNAVVSFVFNGPAARQQ